MRCHESLLCTVCCVDLQQVTPRNIAPTFTAMAVINEQFEKISLSQYTEAGQSLHTPTPLPRKQLKEESLLLTLSLF